MTQTQKQRNRTCIECKDEITNPKLLAKITEWESCRNPVVEVTAFCDPCHEWCGPKDQVYLDAEAWRKPAMTFGIEYAAVCAHCGTSVGIL